MKNPVGKATILGLLCAMTLAPLSTIPVKADDFLEKMQGEVAAIVKRSAGGVVSIQDERLLTMFMGLKASVDPKAGGEKNSGPPSPEAMHKEFPKGFPKVGSGFSVGDGYILTTADVLDGMQNPLVVTGEGKFLRADVVGIDKEQNVGLLKLKSTLALMSLPLGNSNYVLPGHFTISIGNQFGHFNTVSLSIVSGIREDGFATPDHFYMNLLQIAGSIGPGTSGAPLLNARGEVIGMISGVFTSEGMPPIDRRPKPGSSPESPQKPPENHKPDSQEGGRGQGGGRRDFRDNRNGMNAFAKSSFAIPINDAKYVMENILSKKIEHGWLGVDFASDRDMSEKNGEIHLKFLVKVKSVYPASPALSAGFVVGDILVSLNGKPIQRISSVRAALVRTKPNDSVQIVISRNGKEKSIEVRLGSNPKL